MAEEYAERVRSAFRERRLAVPTDVKLSLGMRLNIYDAAWSYGAKHDMRTRAVLRDPEFRSAWREFRGGGLKGGKPTSFTEKMQAARKLGWHKTRDAAIERLRGTSP